MTTATSIEFGQDLEIKIIKKIMTPQEELHAVETAIRQKLPRLMEVSEGCILKRKSHFELYSDYVILKIKRYDFSTYIEIDGKHKGSFSIENEKLLDHFEIIGHNILLSDVLEWLKTISIGGGIDTEKLHKILYYWDLSKPYLKDQSEKLINFLYNLIKNN